MLKAAKQKMSEMGQKKKKRKERKVSRTENFGKSSPSIREKTLRKNSQKLSGSQGNKYPRNPAKRFPANDIFRNFKKKITRLQGGGRGVRLLQDVFFLDVE
jgi:hypothetical protein